MLMHAQSDVEKMMNNELAKWIRRAYGNKLDLEVVSSFYEKAELRGRKLNKITKSENYSDG